LFAFILIGKYVNTINAHVGVYVSDSQIQIHWQTMA
jgi:hypothetical protein